LVIEHLKNAQNCRDFRIRRETLDRIAAFKNSTLSPGATIRENLSTEASERIEPSFSAPRQETVDSALSLSANEFLSAQESSETLEPPDETVLRSAFPSRTLDELRSAVLRCTKCPQLVKFRHSVVFGVGDPKAELMFIGEAPGADEDRQGEPFVGKAGELLTKIILTMGFRRDEVYIANVLKCRPDTPAGTPGNRQPTTVEMETCLPYLREQIELIKPKIMVALGGVAMKGLLGKTDPMKNLRGRWHTFQSIPVMATFHPSYLLRNQALSEKRKVWEDMLLVLERLEKPISEKQRYYFMPR
jgi:uracil-DNA glycosylase